MDLRKTMYLLFFMLISASTARSMDNKSIGSGMIAGGVGLVVWGVHNNKDFMKKRTVKYLDNEKTIQKTLYFDEWFKEVLVPISGGVVLMFSGFCLMSAGFNT